MTITHEIFAQKQFQVTVKLDSTINPLKVQYQFNDGKAIRFFPDTFKNNRIIELKGTYYSKFASLDVSYISKDLVYYYYDFFLNDKHADIDLFYKPNPDQLLQYHHIQNATPVYDTITNKIYRDLCNFNKAENLAVYNFFKKNRQQIFKNDSITNIYQQMVKSVDIRSMGFLKKHPNDYFSFWYFMNSIGGRSYYQTDPLFLKELLTYFKTTFPKNLTQSVEGKEFIKRHEITIHPLTVNAEAPPFNIKTIDGKNISLAGLKGKYVLLDFWATWCVPCMEEIPLLKKIRNSFPPNKLAMIGISQDHDLTRLKLVIQQKGMNWFHFFDSQTNINRLYGIDEYPTFILLNDKGKIIYKSDHMINDMIEIPKLLKTLLPISG